MDSSTTLQRNEELLTVSPRVLGPTDVMFGGNWLSSFNPDDPDKEDLGQDNANATLLAAVDAGIREFDTAPKYGKGTAEERMGNAIAHLARQRPDALPQLHVYTKVGRFVCEADGSRIEPGFDQPGRAPPQSRILSNDYTALGVERSLTESLARMQLANVYALRVHDPNDNSLNRGVSSDDVAVCLGEDGACLALRRLRREGVIQHVSLGMNSNLESHIGAPQEIVRMISSAPSGTFDSALLAGGWNLLSQAGLPCLAECERNGIPVHIAGIYASGILAGGKTYAYQPATDDAIQRTSRWHELAQRHSVSLPAVAIAFAALPACVERLVIGMGSPKEVEQNMAWLRESALVPVQIWKEARTLGLISPDVPLP